MFGYSRYQLVAGLCVGFGCLWVSASGTESLEENETLQDDSVALANRYEESIQQLLAQFCFDCHSGEQAEGDVDLSIFATTADIKADLETWERVRSMLSSAQMPPIDAAQPNDSERESLVDWVKAFLAEEAKAQAGDPGPVVLRRLSNAEYTYSLRDLTGIESLNPAAQFPIDGASGEGFTNVGSGLVMSPALLTKYLDAAKEVADHAVFLPDGMRFSEFSSRRDWTDEALTKIRTFYGRFTDESGDRIPLRTYLEVLNASRRELQADIENVDEIAARHHLSPVYLAMLWETLEGPDIEGSFILNSLRRMWKQGDGRSLDPFLQFVDQWQNTLWRFNTIGHIGREGGPISWQERVDPFTTQHDFNLPFDDSIDSSGPTFSLAIENLRSAADESVVRWQNPRLVAEGQSDLPLAKIKSIHSLMLKEQKIALEKTDQYLDVAAGIRVLETVPDINELALQHDLDPGVLATWLKLLRVRVARPVIVRGHFTEKMTQAAGYDFVTGWGTDQTPSVVANSSDQQVRIPGIAPPKSILVHPSPTLFVAVGWQCPEDGEFEIQASLHDAHPECGNGVEWRLVHQTASDLTSLWAGGFAIAGKDAMEPRSISIKKGDLVAFEIGPRESSHACDLTQIDLTIKEVDGEQRTWNIARDVAPDILKANPHADRFGNDAVWHFYRGEMSSWTEVPTDTLRVPEGTALARWIESQSPEAREALTQEIKEIALELVSDLDQVTSTNNELHLLLREISESVDVDRIISNASIDPRFGVFPNGSATHPTDLVVDRCETIEITIPAGLAKGRSLVVSGALDDELGVNGIVQLSVAQASDRPPNLSADLPVVIHNRKSQQATVQNSFEDFRSIFPAALCYSRIVPVDEVVTLTLYFREDDHLQRLFLQPSDREELDRLWDELLFVSQQPLAQVVALEQIIQFATQDRPDLVTAFEPLKSPVRDAAKRFQQRLTEVEPMHLDSILTWTSRVWRRPLSENESTALIQLYQKLREDGQEHEPAARLVLARVMTSPNFLYRREHPISDGNQGPVSNRELATRLSYFLWSSVPDDILRDESTIQHLNQDNVLENQALRMLKDERIRRLAIEFACQWLHLKDFDQNDDKNESLYPEFANQRVAMYEETVLFFEDFFRNNGSILSLIDADHTFLNEDLATHYGIPNVTGESWQRVDNVSEFERGGLLGMASVLSSQSGASRTSPILRGNWIFETLLGEKLPKPPADVPVLPDTIPNGLSTRQLIERHRADPACAKCHNRIDPYGIALEQFDAIGRRRENRADTRTLLLDGQQIDGVEELKKYLMNHRSDDVVRQFCRKLLGFALGRSIQLSDEPLIDEMLARLEKDDYRVHTAIFAIIESRQFREKRGVNWAQP